MAAEKRRRLSPDARRAEILQAAKELFAEQGYEKTQLQHIAARIGASRSIFAPYFNGKEDIYDALFAQWEEEEAKTRVRFPLIEDSAIKSLRNAIRLTMNATGENFNKWAGKDEMLNAAIRSRDGYATHITRVLMQNDLARYSLQPLFAYGQMSGEFRKGDPLTQAQLLMYLIGGMYTNSQLYHWEITDELIDAALDLFTDPNYVPKQQEEAN